jgi:SpoVK/Ycf46/Vps4 family AAA+-type ATPase
MGRYHPRSSRRPKPPSAAPEETAEPSGLLLLENPGLKLSDLVVSEETRLELGFLVQMLRAWPGEAPVMLFHGPPGTGKTHAARCLAGELDRPLGSASLDRLQTKWHGDTEKAFRRAFEEAAKAGAILLLDEVDALLCDRGTMVASWQISQVNTLLKLLEAPPVPVVLCTNFLRVLDAAVHRRIQHLVEFPVPDRNQRLVLWQKELHRNGLNRLLFLDLQAAAGLPLTGGLIRNAALQFARRIAVYGDDYPADTESLLALARKELPKIDCEVREKRIGF